MRPSPGALREPGGPFLCGRPAPNGFPAGAAFRHTLLLPFCSIQLSTRAEWGKRRFSALGSLSLSIRASGRQSFEE